LLIAQTGSSRIPQQPRVFGRRSRVDAVSAPSISFWRQDLNWYIQQQSWTQSFYQIDQNWTAELSGSSPRPATTSVAQIEKSAGSANIADQKIVTLVNTPSESALSGALQASGARSGTLVNLLT
jgi:hypothetical protein